MTWLLVTRCPLWPSCGALGLFPGIHIAQFPFQVIGNCGVIFLMQCSNRYKLKILQCPDGVPARIEVRIFLSPGAFAELHPQLSVGAVHNMTVSWRWRLASISSAAWGWV